MIIDLEGGDVVGAALKAYPKTLDDPSDPFVLLERNSRELMSRKVGWSVATASINLNARDITRNNPSTARTGRHL